VRNCSKGNRKEAGKNIAHQIDALRFGPERVKSSSVASHTQFNLPTNM